MRGETRETVRDSFSRDDGTNGHARKSNCHFAIERSYYAIACERGQWDAMDVVAWLSSSRGINSRQTGVSAAQKDVPLLSSSLSRSSLESVTINANASLAHAFSRLTLPCHDRDRPYRSYALIRDFDIPLTNYANPRLPRIRYESTRVKDLTEDILNGNEILNSRGILQGKWRFDWNEVDEVFNV